MAGVHRAFRTTALRPVTRGRGTFRSLDPDPKGVRVGNRGHASGPRFDKTAVVQDSESRLIAWVRQELVSHGVATETEADEALDRCRAVLHQRDETSAATFLARFESACVNAVTAARATERCQGGSEWWHSSGASAWRHLADGRFVEAMAAQAEFLAGPTDVEVDFNWPDEKLFPMAEIPNGCCEGDRVILGDGEGGRADATLVVQDGQRGIVPVAGTYRDPTVDLWAAAFDEAKAVRGPTV